MTENKDQTLVLTLTATLTNKQVHLTKEASPKTAEEFFTKGSTDASQPSRFRIPTSTGHHERGVRGNDNKQNNDNGPTYGHGGRDGSRQQHQFINRSYFSNDHKGDRKKEAAPRTQYPASLSMSMRQPTSTHDNRPSKPTNDIAKAMPQLVSDRKTNPSVGVETRNKHSNVKQEPQSNTRPSGAPITITSEEAAKKYGGPTTITSEDAAKKYGGRFV